MCDVSKIQNVLKHDLFSQLEKEVFVMDVIKGVIKVDKLDVNQYFRVARKLSESVEKGFGGTVTDFIDWTEEYKLLADLIESVYVFSGAKQYQLVREIQAMLSEKEYTNKDQIISEGVKIFDKYNERYFAPEYENFELQGKAARNWIEFVKWNQE